MISSRKGSSVSSISRIPSRKSSRLVTRGFDPEALAHLDVVRVDRIQVVRSAEVFRIAKDGVSTHAFVKPVFPLHDHPEVLVVQEKALGVDLFDLRGGKFLNAHQEGAVPVDIDDFLVRTGDLDSDGRRIAKSHRPQPK